MNEPTSVLSKPIPLLRIAEEKLLHMRTCLEFMFLELLTVHDVALVCSEASASPAADLDHEISRVLSSCGANKLHDQLDTLTKIIEQLGGTTDFTEHGKENNNGEG